MKKINQDINNGFVHIEPIHYTYQIKAITEYALLVDTNFPSVDFVSFYNALEEYNFKRFSKSEKRLGKESVIMLKMEFLLDKKHDGSILKTLSKEIMEFIQNKYFECVTPYWCWLIKYGKGYYLEFFISEREFFPEGQRVKVKKAFIQYKNPKTKKICKKDDPDAVLWERPAVYEYTQFGIKKIRPFNIPDSRFFEATIKLLKNEWIRLLEETADTKVRREYTINKIGYTNATDCRTPKPLERRKMIEKINQEIKNAEKHLSMRRKLFIKDGASNKEISEADKKVKAFVKKTNRIIRRCNQNDLLVFDDKRIFLIDEKVFCDEKVDKAFGDYLLRGVDKIFPVSKTSTLATVPAA